MPDLHGPWLEGVQAYRVPDRLVGYELPHVGLALIGFIMIVRFGILNIILGVIVNTTLKAQKDRETGISAKVQEEQAKILTKLKDFFIACRGERPARPSGAAS